MGNFTDLVGRYNIKIDMVLGTMLILVVAVTVIFYIDRFLSRFLVRGRFRTYFSYETVVMINRLISIMLWLAVATLLLSFWGVSVSGLWTVMASVAAVIGVGFLAVWTMVSNITANLFLTIWRPFYMGAIVEILPESLKGRVVDRNMMFTVLREQDGGALYIPNNTFFQKVFRVSETNHQHLFEYFERENEAMAQQDNFVNPSITQTRRES